MLMLMTKLGHNIMPDIDNLRDEVLNVKDTVVKKRVKISISNHPENIQIYTTPLRIFSP